MGDPGMADSSRKYVAATAAAEAGEIERRGRRGREQRIAMYASIAVALIVTVFFMARSGMLGQWAMFGNPAESGGAGAAGGTAGGPPGGGQTAEGGEEDMAPRDVRAPLDKALTAKGLYLTMDSAGTPSTMASLVTFMRTHQGLNSMVIDVKDNSGRVPTRPPANIPALPGHYTHIPALVQVLHDYEGYYMIARIVAFQDPYRSETAPERAIRNADGSLWYDRDGRLWLNPYDKKNWEYVKDIALWAVDMGFDEIQLDYVRFPDSAQGLEKTGAVLMPGADDFQDRSDAIVAFLKYMDAALDKRAYFSADIFGFVTIAVDDMGIGQDLEDLAACVDFISPMVYPSHYFNAGIYGFQLPEAHPYEVVSKAMDQAIQRTTGLRSKIRPWLQDFSLRVHYGSAEVQGQIQAVFEHDIDTFMLWNPANVYTDGVKYTK
jgi:hypothetical protein